jgi:hypothetical protein
MSDKDINSDTMHVIMKGIFDSLHTFIHDPFNFDRKAYKDSTETLVNLWEMTKCLDLEANLKGDQEDKTLNTNADIFIDQLEVPFMWMLRLYDVIDYLK